MLDREEYIEQAHFFRTVKARISEGQATQDLLSSVREEILATTKLPMAIDFMASELKMQGVFGTAMAKLSHYFTPFQSFVVAEAEKEQGQFDLLLALEILAREANYRAEGATPQGLFLYQFESISRNRLGYDAGLAATAQDPIFDDVWRPWILTVRRQVGLVDLADLIYVRSAHHIERQERLGSATGGEPPAVLFGPREGRIALANRGKDPFLLFAALHRQLGYPEVPRRQAVDQSPDVTTALARRMERVETRLKLLEEEHRGGIDISRFYGPAPPKPPDEAS
jgi:hypothetical protein